MTILVTRPEPGASRTMQALEASGLAALSCPLFSVVVSDTVRPSGKFAALLVTSGHGAEGLTPVLADLPAGLPVFAVGDRTAEAMTANGFSNVTSASGDQKALAKLVLAKLPPRYRVLLATGEDHKDGLPAAFAEAGHEIALWIRYRAEAVAELPEAARAAMAGGSIDTVLHFSRRASEVFLALCEKADLSVSAASLRHVALSQDVAEPLGAAGIQNVMVAAQPDEAHLLALAAGDTLPASVHDVTAHDVTVMVPSRDEPPASRVRTTPRSRKVAAMSAELADVATVAASPVAVAATVGDPEETMQRNPTVEPVPEPLMQAGTVADRETIPPNAPAAPVVKRGFGLGALVAAALASGVIGAGLVSFMQPLLGQSGVTAQSSPAVAEMAARLAKLEAVRPQPSAPDIQALVQAALQSAPPSPQVREQVGALERRIIELAARPQAGGTGADRTVIAELQAKLAAVENATRTVGAPSASATGAAKLIVSDRLARALGDGRPFTDEMTALTALGAATEPMRALAPLAAGGAPAMATIIAAFRKLRPVFAAEPASPDAHWSERLLRLSDGLVRVRSTGAVQGSSPAAVASRIDQALQRGDAGAAAVAFAELPEPARRAGEAWIATVNQRAAADQAVKTITDDAIKALSGQK